MNREGNLRSIASTAAPRPRPGGAPDGITLLQEEAEILRSMRDAERTVRRGGEIIRQGQKCSTLFLLEDGLGIRYKILADGRRQILNVLLPGEFAGVPGSFFETALYSIKTLTDAVVSPIPLSRVLGLFETHPRLAAKLFWSFACEAAIYAEHVIAIGRRSALERVAHFLLELLSRLQAVGLADARCYKLPMTQEMIGDMLGLSIPYLNRVLQQLRAEGLVAFDGGKVVIHDVSALSALADFEQGYLRPLSIGELLPPCRAAPGSQ